MRFRIRFRSQTDNNNIKQKTPEKYMLCVFKLFAAIKKSFMHEFRFND